MGGYWSLDFGTFEFESGPAGYSPAIIGLFIKNDLLSSDTERIYSIKSSELVKRLTLMGYSREAIENDLKEYKKKLLNKKESISFYDDTFQVIFPKNDFWELFKKLRYNKIVTILRDTYKGNEIYEYEGHILELLMNGGDRFVIDPYYDPFNLYYILVSEIVEDEIIIKLDISEMSGTELWEYFDYNEDHFNRLLVSNKDDSLIRYSKYPNEEDMYNELKEIKNNNPLSSIKRNFLKYFIGFMNSDGGKIIFGVDDNRIVKGFLADSKLRDEIRQYVQSTVISINPPVLPNNLEIKFLKIIANGSYEEDLYCLEILVKKGKSEEMYFKEGGNTWIKLDGILKELKGYELFRYIRDRF